MLPRPLSLLLAFLALWVAPAAVAAEVLISYVENETSHVQVVEAIERELGTGIRIVRQPWRPDEGLKRETVPNADLVVTVGVETTRSQVSARTALPQLAVMVPRITFQNLLETRPPPQKLTAVFVDQPLARQLGLIRLLLPGAQRVGLVYGKLTQGLLDELQALARARGLELVSYPAWRDSELYPALQYVLQNADVLLALPDPEIVNTATSQNLLLTSFRFRKPVFGYSAGYVRAGALASIYSTPGQIGQTAAKRIRDLLARTPQAFEAVYARDYSIAVNRGLAANLGLQVPEDESLLDLLRKTEARP
jgi:putative tryptophan/tyrosine transport system substrate-binding protein